MGTFGPYNTTARQDKALQILADTWNANHPNDPPIDSADYLAARVNDLLNRYASNMPEDIEFKKKVVEEIDKAIEAEDKQKLDDTAAALNIDRSAKIEEKVEGIKRNG